MSIVLKFIKKKEFTAQDAKHVHYTTAYNGRVIAVSTLNLEAKDIVADEKASTVTVSGDLEVVNRSWADPVTGEARVGLVLLPKLGLNISQF